MHYKSTKHIFKKSRIEIFTATPNKSAAQDINTTKPHQHTGSVIIFGGGQTPFSFNIKLHKCLFWICRELKIGKTVLTNCITFILLPEINPLTNSFRQFNNALEALCNSLNVKIML